ncbi:hypothetical protein [Fibrobacter sp. UBA4297]|uniref:hypothetical protein n=1 Tax=Fibrobacter sp. UBA4297 TaxID=1946536 RepID=UPI0025BF713D|nr:hypothetical protein [Fibrobacter sp. UBA4297]
MSEGSFFPLRQPHKGDFYCEPLSKAHKAVIKTFQPSHSKGKNLAIYLKKKALSDIENGIARTFLVFEDPGYLCGFFTLKAGLFPLEAKGKLFYTLPGIDLVYFAKNGAFVGNGNTDVGSIMFFDFILPIVREVKEYIGASHLYIYAIHESPLQETYKSKYGFSYPPAPVKEFIESHIKPDYDEDCDFMFIHLGGENLQSKNRQPKSKKKISRK